MLNESNISWNDITPIMQTNFKSWLKHRVKEYDKSFTIALFETLPDDIKLEFYFTLAKEFGVKTLDELKTFKRSSNHLIMGVKRLRVSPEIQEAIYNVIPLTTPSKLLTISKSELDGWGSNNFDYAVGKSQEEIDASREQRKVDTKLSKLKARVNAIKSYEQYEVTLADPLFDRGMFETILKRMENGTAIDSRYDDKSKSIMSLIVNHPLATTEDLIRITRVKNNWGGRSTQKYNSTFLNTALSKKDDFSMNELMKMIKLQQYDIKVNAMKRKDLSDADKNIIINYSLKHHMHKPEQIREIFEAGNILDLLDKKDYIEYIINGLKKKYSLDNGSNGLKLLEIIDGYGWLSKLSDDDKNSMVDVITKTYNDGRLTKERLLKFMSRFGDNIVDFATIIYDRTGDEDFLPKTIKDMFLF